MERILFYEKMINRKLFFVILVLCVIASILVIPYSLAVTPKEIVITRGLLFISGVQNFLLFSVVIFLGLLLSNRVGLRMPILQEAIEGKNPIKELRSTLITFISMGLLAGIMIVLISLPFNRFTPELPNKENSFALWKAILALFYGSIAEEVLLRLFLVSLFAWISER